MNSVIVAALRTAVAPRGGALSALSIHELAAPVVKTCLAQSGIDGAQVDEIIVGNALGAGGNPARVIALAAGLPVIRGRAQPGQTMLQWIGCTSDSRRSD